MEGKFRGRIDGVYQSSVKLIWDWWLNHPRRFQFLGVAVFFAVAAAGALVFFTPTAENPTQLSAPVAEAAACQSNGTGGGDWNAAGSWTSCGGVAPTSADTVTIVNGDTITLNTSATVDTIDIQNGGTLTNDGNARTLTLDATTGTHFTLGGTGTFTPSTFISVTLTSSAAITLTSGTITFYNLTVNLTGTTGRTFTFGSGAITVNNNFSANQTSAIGAVPIVLTLNMGAAISVTGTTTLTKTQANGGVTLNTDSGSNHALTSGFIVLNTGTTLTANSSTVTLTGTSGTLFTKTGTFNQGTSEVKVTSASGTPTLLSANTTFHKLTIDSAATVINAGAFTITMSNADAANKLYIKTGVLNDSGKTIAGTANGTLQIDNGATLCLSGTTAATNATCDSGATQTTASTFPSGYTNGNITLGTTSTVSYLADAAMTVSSVPTYGNLKLNPVILAGRIFTFDGATTINGDLTIQPGTGANALTVNMGGTITVAAGKTTTITRTTSSTSTLDTISGQNYALSTGFLNIATGGTLTAQNATITLTGTSGTLFTRVGTFTEGDSTVTVTSASGTPTLMSGTATFHILTINAAATIINAGAAITTDNDAGNKLYIQSGVFNIEGNAVTPGTNGTLQIDSAGTLCVGGTTGATNATCDSGATQTGATTFPAFTTYTFDAASTVIYLNDVAQTVDATPTYGNLKLAPVLTSGRTYTFETATATINGNFTINPTAASSLLLTVNMAGAINVAATKTTTITKTSSATSKLDTVSGSNYALTTGLLDLASGGTLTANAATITLTGTSGTLFTRAGTFTQGTSTVVMNPNASVTLTSGTITFATLNLTPTLSGSSKTYTFGGSAVTIATAFNINPDAASAFALTVNLGAQISATAADITITGTNSGTSTLDTTGSNHALSAKTINIASAGTLTANGSTITVGGSSGTLFTRVGVFNANNSTVAFTTSGAVTLTSGTFTFYNLALSLSGSNSRTFTFGSGAITVNNDFTANQSSAIGSPVLTINMGAAIAVTGTTSLSRTSGTASVVLDTIAGSNYTFSTGTLTIGTGTTVTANNSAINATGNWTNNGTFSAGNSTVTLNGSSTQTLSGTLTSGSAFYNLLITNSSGGGASNCELGGWTPSVDFAVAATVTNNYTITTNNVRVEYNNGSTYTIANINWDAAASNMIYFRNSVASGSWLLNVSGTQTAVNYVNVSRSDATGGNTIQAADGTNTDCGNNNNWSFVNPDNAASAAQKKTDDTVIATGGWTNETSVKFTATVTDSDTGGTLQLCVEKDLLGVAFSNTEDSCGTAVASGATATLTIGSLTDTAEYHWQVRVKDSGGYYSAWVSYDVNAETDRDFGIDTTACTYAGTIYDGTTEDVDDAYNTGTLDTLSSNWDAFTCAASGLNKYQYSIGTTIGGTDIKNWTDNSTTESVTAGSLNLRTNQNYFFNVRAVDNAANTSSVYSSNGQDILPSISFSLGATTITFSNLNDANNRSDTKTLTLTTSTNAFGGYVIRQYANALLTGGLATIPMFEGGSYASPAAWPAAFCTSGSNCGYGYTSDDTTIGGSNKFSSGTLFAPISLTAFGDIVADHTDAVNGSTGPVSNELFTLTHKVAVDALQNAKTYQTEVLYIVTGTF